MFLQSLMKFHQRIFKILRKQNVTDTLSFVRSSVRTDGRTDNVKTVYPPTNTVCGAIKMRSRTVNCVTRSGCSKIVGIGLIPPNI